MRRLPRVIWLKYMVGQPTQIQYYGFDLSALLNTGRQLLKHVARRPCFPSRGGGGGGFAGASSVLICQSDCIGSVKAASAQGK